MPTQTIEKSIHIPITAVQKQGGVVILFLKQYNKLCKKEDFSYEDKFLLNKAKNDFEKGNLSSPKNIW